MWSTREHVRLNQTQSDGKIYGMVAVNECFHCYYSQKMWVNTEWMKALGIATPVTVDDFYQMLKAFKTKDPNRNGKADEIPLSGSYVSGWNTKIDPFLMMPFIYNDGGNRHLVRNGKIIQAYDQPEWREGLRYMRKLYAEGLILRDTFTQDQNQLKAIGENPDVAILGAWAGGHVGIAFQMEGPSHRDQIYKTIPPLVGLSKERYARYTPDYGWGNYYITNKAKNPAAAVRLGDFMYTPEYSVWNGWGMKGDSWTDPDPGTVGLDGHSPATRKQTKSWGTGDPLVWWNQLGSFLQSTEVRTGAQRSNNPSDLEVILFDETRKNYEPFTPPMSMIVPPLTYGEKVSAELSDLETTLNSFVNEYTVRFITGDLDVNSADWDKYLAELKKIGVDRYVEIKQQAYEGSAFYQKTKSPTPSGS
jgi:putative aldouronate transport system substrate-binding protein